MGYLSDVFNFSSGIKNAASTVKDLASAVRNIAQSAPSTPAPTPTLAAAPSALQALSRPISRGAWTPPQATNTQATSKAAYAALGLKKGGKTSSEKAKSSSKPTVKSASKRGDGLAQRGKTRGKMV